MNLKPFIDQLDLGIDETYRGDCPVCQGKNTFTATRSVGGIIFNCYKNSCEISGKSARSITLEDITALRSSKTIEAMLFFMSRTIGLVPTPSLTRG